MIKYSVIVPIYNSEKTIRRCVNSLLTSCPDDAEIILVNDGSTDGSGAICRVFEQEHPQIRLIEKDNGGVSTARNAGLDTACGTYISFVDSDDYVSGDYFPEIRRALAEGSRDLIRFSYCVDDGIRIREMESAAFDAGSRGDSLPKILDNICNKSLNSPWAKVYCKKIIDRHSIRFPVGASMAEDRAFNISYCLHVESYCVREQKIYFVNTQNEGSLSRKQHADLNAQFQITERYASNAIGDAEIPEEEKESFRRAINFGICRGVYRDAKELHRNGVGWINRQKVIWNCCAQTNQKQMRYPKTRYCRMISIPVQLYMTPVIDFIAWKLIQ